MLNKAPIFINGFQHGGTGILLNLIVSHPNVCQLSHETHILFYGRRREPIKKWVHRFFYIPILVTARQHIFWPTRLYPRNTIPKFMMRYIDLMFYLSKITTSKNKFKDDVTRNSRQEIANSRLLCKNVTAVNLAARLFADMYPDATFIGLVRNGFALGEGFMRRGWTAERFGEMYERVCQQMIHDADTMDNYYIIRFEDLISDPITVVKQVYSYANLDLDSVAKLRLPARLSMNKDGSRKYMFGGEIDLETFWFPFDQIKNHLRQDVNKNQIARLSEQDKQILLQYAQKSLGHFGYL